MQQLQTLKGFRDFLPEETLKRDWLRKKIITVFEQWGYDPLETPTLEYFSLFEGQIGEDEKLFYKFQDPGGRTVALRYDQTVPAARVVAQYRNTLHFPFKRYQIQSAFRAENPQRGRYREFLQCDADIFGSASVMADAEVIALSLDIYRQIGFPQAKVLINDRELLQPLPYEAIVAIDKLKKIGQEGVIKDMNHKGIASDKAHDYISFVQNLKPNESIDKILHYLKSYGFDSSWYAFEPTLARSFSYSSGPIWEIIIPEFSAGSVLGGERYNHLIEKISGQSVPATGFAVGFDRTLEAAEQYQLIPTVKTKCSVLIALLDVSVLPYALTTAAGLRSAGITCDIYAQPEHKLDKQIKFADKKGIPYVIILGENEQQQQIVTLKNLQSHQQQTGSLTDTIALISHA